MSGTIYSIKTADGKVGVFAMQVCDGRGRGMRKVHPFGKPELGSSWAPRSDWKDLSQEQMDALVAYGPDEIQTISA